MWLDSVYTTYILAVSLLLILESVFFITRRAREKHASNILTRAKEEVQEIAQFPLHSPHPLLQITTNGRIIFGNPVALKTFKNIQIEGFSHPVLREVKDLFTPSATTSREVIFENNIYQQSITPTKVRNEQAYIIYFHDITERKNYEKELQRAHKLAEEARQMAEDAKEARGEFLANMSHELRTPMNGIIGLSDILVEAGLKSEHQPLIEAVNSSAKNLLILLNDILDFSKIEAGELSIENIPFDIRKVINQIEFLQKTVAVQKELILRSKIDETIPHYFIGDPSRLQQILNNLVSNAIKFTEKGSVTLKLSGDNINNNNFQLNIAVIDTGIGIPKDKQAKVFEKFQQAETSTARKYGGTGLGLSITKDLTELMGGIISIESEEGIGTTFTISIPFEIAHGYKDTEKASSHPAGAAVDLQAKLMIVDDHPINLLYMRQTLQKFGFQSFDEASSGKQALELFQKTPSYDLILMDCQMPEMDGFEAACAIRAENAVTKSPTIIAVTADAMKGAEEKCKSAGMDDYISKPVDKEKLKMLLQKWIPGNENTPHPDSLIEKTPTIEEPAMQDDDIDFDHNIIFDWEQLKEYTEGEAEIENQLITMFLDNLKTDLKELQRSYATENLKSWDEAAHKLYGACSHIGANALAHICDQAQNLKTPNIQDIEPYHTAILNEYKKLYFVLQKKAIGGKILKTS